MGAKVAAGTAVGLGMTLPAAPARAASGAQPIFTGTLSTIACSSSWPPTRRDYYGAGGSLHKSYTRTQKTGRRAGTTPTRPPRSSSMSSSPVRSAAAVAALAVLAGCVGGAGMSAGPFVMATPDGIAGMQVDAGQTAVIGIGRLDLGESEPVTVRAVRVVRGAGDAEVADAERVMVYQRQAAGGVGAITTEDPRYRDGAWDFRSAEGLTVRPEDPALDMVVFVRGRSRGAWRADYVEVAYVLDGAERTQRLLAAATVCVDGSCEPGVPEWFEG